MSGLPALLLAVLAAPAWAATPLFEPDVSPEGFFARVRPDSAGVDRRVLERLVREAGLSHSHALLVLKDGKVLAERYYGRPRRPLHLMSMTKSVVSLAVGRLLADGKIPSLDAPLSTWFPEWRRGRKADVTLRHVLTHASGLRHELSAVTLNNNPDRLDYARGLPLDAEPGGEFSYNNEAVQLLSGVVAAAAGVSLDAYLGKELFEPMGITDWTWTGRDRAGNVAAYADLKLHPRDVARIGQLVLDRGLWNRRSLLPAEWIRLSGSPGRGDTPFHGLLWWLGRPRSLSAGASPAPDRPRPMRAAGWQGQNLIVYPAPWNLVIVRMREPEEGNTFEEDKKYGFLELFDLAERLCRP